MSTSLDESFQLKKKTFMIQDPPNTNHGSGIQAKTSRQMLTNKKFDFLHHFLVNDKEN